MLLKYGLACKQTHLPCYEHLTCSQIIDDEMELSIKRAIKASAELGAEWATYHPRTDIKSGFSRIKSFKANKDILNNYLEDAEKYGVGLAVENMPLYPTSHADWRFFGGGWEELCELCDTFNSDKIGICWDFGHANTASIDQPSAFKEIGSRLKMTHVHDNCKNGDHHQLPMLGDAMWGCIDWKSVMKALKEIKYEGSLALEVIYPPFQMWESFIKLSYESLEYLKGL